MEIDVQTNYIVWAIPLFLGFMALEIWICHRKNLNYYLTFDSISNISTGMADQLLTALLGSALFLFPYHWVYQNLKIFHWNANAPLTWILAFLGTDLAYYLWHRMSHRVNFMWAVHQVHHQGQEYNLSLALRQNGLAMLTSVGFYLPLAVLGFPPLVFLAVKSINLLYQFWIHTRLIGKLGIFEWVFNTPSHHRGHHGINPCYLDKNYGGVLIIFDRLLGTFVEEKETPYFGLLRPLQTWNALRSWVDPWKLIMSKASAFNHPRDKILAWVAPPGWMPKGFSKTSEVLMFETAKANKSTRSASSINRYSFKKVLILFSLTMTATALFLFYGHTLPLSQRVFITILIFLSIFFYGRLSDTAA